MKKFLLILFALLGFPAARADMAVIKPAALTYSGAATETLNLNKNTSNGEKSGSITGVFSMVSSSLRVDDNTFRWYANSTLTLTPSENVTITKIEFTNTYSSSNPIAISSNIGTPNVSGNAITWEGSATSTSPVTLTNNRKAQIQMAYVEVTYTAAQDDRTPVTLTWSETTASATLGQDFNAPTLTIDPTDAKDAVVITSSNPGIVEIASDGTVTPKKGGVTTITASISDSKIYKDAKDEYVLTVTDPNAKNYALITSLDGLYDGAMGIIACQSSNDAMGIKQNNNNRGIGTITFNSDKSEILTYGDDVAIVRFDLVDATKGQYAIYVTNGTDVSGNSKCGYLQQKTAGSNYLTVVDSKVPATISIDSDGNATIEVTLSGNTKYYIKRNNGSDLYSSYKSGQYNIQLYIMPNASSKDKAGLSYETTTYTIEKGDAFTAPDVVNPNKIEGITYESNAPEVVAVDPATGTVTVKGVGVATITASSKETDKYLAGTASYTVTVNGAVDNLADFIALGSKYDVTLTANFTSTVTYTSGSHIYLTDGENYGYMYMDNLNLKDGDVIPAGWKGKITLYNTTVVEITDVVDIQTTGLENKPVNPTAVTSISTDMENQYVVVYGVEFENGITTTTNNKTFTGLLGSQEIKCYNRDGLEDVPAGYYEVKGIVTVYQGNPQITLSHLWANPEKPVFQGTAEGTEWPSTLQEGMVLTWTVKYGTISYVDNNQQASEVAAYAADENGWEISADGKTATYTVPAGTKAINYSIINTVNGVKSAEAKLIVGEDGNVSGIEDVVIENAPAVYYNLQGVRVEGDLTPGLYIRRQGNTTTKVIVR